MRRDGNRGRLITTAEGSSTGAFAPLDWGLLIAVGGIWGSSFLLIDIGLDHFEPGLITTLRIALGTLALAAIPSARTAIAKEDRGRVALLGVVWIAIPFVLYPLAQQYIDSSLAGMLGGAMPIFGAVIAALLLRRWPRRLVAAGIAMGFAGVVAVSIPSVTEAQATAAGTLMVLVATLCYGLATNLAVPLQQRYGAPSIMLRAQAVALVLVLPFGLVDAGRSEFDLGSLAAVGALGVLGTGMALIAMAHLAGRVGATRAGAAIYLVPLVAIVLGVVFRDEAVHRLALAGIGLVLAGAWFMSRADHKAASA